MNSDLFDAQHVLPDLRDLPFSFVLWRHVRTVLPDVGGNYSWFFLCFDRVQQLFATSFRGLLECELKVLRTNDHLRFDTRIENAIERFQTLGRRNASLVDFEIVA